MQLARSTLSNASEMNVMSADVGVLSHRGTAPVPCGVIVTKPCRSPNGPSALIFSWISAPRRSTLRPRAREPRLQPRRASSGAVRHRVPAGEITLVGRPPDARDGVDVGRLGSQG